MSVFLARRILRGLVTLMFVVTMVFAATRATGDPTQWLLPDDASPEAHAELRRHLGVDRPIWEQYFRYLGDLARGDFGNSFHQRRPVTHVFAERVPRTVQLMGISLLLAVSFGVPVGIAAALHRNQAADRLLMSISFSAYAVPNFVLGILFILVFSLTLRWLPSGGYGDWRHFLMPVITLGASSAGIIARLMRSSLLDVLQQDYVRTAHAKGIPRRVVFVKHAVRNAFVPVLTILGLQTATLIGGSVVIETVFAWPGAGRLIVDAVMNRDFPVLQFSVLVVATLVVIVTLTVDILYGVLDPRIRVEG